VFRYPKFPRPNIKKEKLIRQFNDELRGQPRLPDSFMQENEETSLRHDNGNTWVLEVQKPPVGYGYGINWHLPESERKTVPSLLVHEAAEFRRTLLRYRSVRMANDNRVKPVVDLVRERFRKAFEIFRKEYVSRSHDEHFDLVLMTLDAENRRLRVAEGLVTAEPNEELPAAYWNFWLPTGVGNAGTCFKTGSARLYVRGEVAREFDYYLPVGSTTPHQILLSFPVNHPDFEKTAKGSPEDVANDRRRQVVAVFNMGSSCEASRLREFLPDKVHGPEGEQRVRESFQAAQDTFQGVFNEIWAILEAVPLDTSSSNA
jgi:hypothetical protein